MHAAKNIIIPGAANHPIALDIFFDKKGVRMPVVVYAHGFNGFKDWGNFDLIAAKFALKGFVLIKFNFSHNGTTPKQPEAFTDLEAFGANNYSKQLEDLNLVIDWVCDPMNTYQAVIDTSNICLIGHSMGGGICILHAAADERINKLITWAGISECTTPWGSWPGSKIDDWKQSGVQYYTNSRTKQEMPLYYQLYEDFVQNRERLDIQKAIRKLAIPLLICHGTLDGAVPVERAYQLKSWQPHAQLFTVESDHVFGRKHPWTAENLPPATEAVIEASLQFLTVKASVAE